MTGPDERDREITVGEALVRVRAEGFAAGRAEGSAAGYRRGVIAAAMLMDERFALNDAVEGGDQCTDPHTHVTGTAPFHRAIECNESRAAIRSLSRHPDAGRREVRREPSSVAEQAELQLSDGGSIPTGSLHRWRARECAFADVSHIFRAHHYRGDSFGGSAKVIFCLSDGTMAAGAAVFGETWHRDTHGHAADGVLELKRFCLLDCCPKNTESYFLGALARLLRKSGYHKLMAYADPAKGHRGTIYLAAGWRLEQEASGGATTYLWRGKEYHARSTTIDRPYSLELRAAIESGEAQAIRGGGKRLFVKLLSQEPTP